MTAGPFRCSFPATPMSASEARRFVRSVLTEAGAPELVDTAMLLVSELVANAVLHTATPPTVVVTVDGDTARLEVHDGSPLLPVPKHYSALSGTGRGLLMVDLMAASWGAEAVAGGGKLVWAQIEPDGRPAVDLLEAEAG